MSEMFWICDALTTVKIHKPFDISKAKGAKIMFCRVSEQAENPILGVK